MEFVENVWIDLHQINRRRIRQTNQFHEAEQHEEIIQFRELLAHSLFISGERHSMEEFGQVSAKLLPIHANHFSHRLRGFNGFVPELTQVMISGESVEKACAEVGEYSDEKMVDEFERFFRAQPAICDFVVELTHESGQRVQELSLFLAYMVFRVVEAEAADPVTKVTPEIIEAGYRDTESWMERISDAQGTELQAAIAASLQRDAEPHLLEYVISELNEPMEDGTELNDEEKGEVFFVVKTVITSLKNESAP